MWTDTQVLKMTAFVTVIVTVLTLITTFNPLVTAATIPIVAMVSFWSLHLSRNVGRRLQSRYAPFAPPPATPPAAAERVQTTERPEHAHRRRTRRRQRGRREG